MSIGKISQVKKVYIATENKQLTGSLVIFIVTVVMLYQNRITYTMYVHVMLLHCLTLYVVNEIMQPSGIRGQQQVARP